MEGDRLIWEPGDPQAALGSPCSWIPLIWGPLQAASPIKTMMVDDQWTLLVKLVSPISPHNKP